MENANMTKESPTDNPSFVEYLRKKRPDAVKLDIVWINGYIGKNVLTIYWTYWDV